MDEPRGNPSNPMPTPESGALSGANGTFAGKNLGRMGINLETNDGEFDPYGGKVRELPTELDTYCHNGEDY